MNLQESDTAREGNERNAATTMANSSSNTKGEIFPFDIILNILKRVPVKSLIQFKCVAKDWNNLFENPYFITEHLHQSLQNNSFLLLQRISQPHLQSHPQTSSICLIEPDLKVQNPQFMDFASPGARVVGSCNGLLCVRHTNHTISVWNPATRQVREVHGTLIDINNFYFVGFGFSPVVNDYKVVRISVSEFYEEDQFVVVDDVSVNQVEVYSLANGSWKEIDSSNLKNLCLMSNSVTTNGVMSWMATLCSDSDDPNVEYVVSFDIGDEVFKVLKGPPPPPYSSHCHSILAVNHNKLAMFYHFMMGNFESSSVDLWVLDDGVSWIKKYSVGPFSGILYPLSIWGNEIVCKVELPKEDGDGGYNGVRTVLSLYNPYSKERKNLPSNSDKYYYAAFNYTESLVPVVNVHP